MALRFRLHELVDEAGISQRELARRSGVSPTTVNRMCGNLTAQVSLMTLDRLAAALGTEPGELLDYAPSRRRRARARRRRR